MNFIIAIIILIVLAYLIISSFKGKSEIQKMLLGIEITIIGGIIAIDPTSSLGGIEYLFVLLGLIVSILGFRQNTQ